MFYVHCYFIVVVIDVPWITIISIVSVMLKVISFHRFLLLFHRCVLMCRCCSPLCNSSSLPCHRFMSVLHWCHCYFIVSLLLHLLLLLFDRFVSSFSIDHAGGTCRVAPLCFSKLYRLWNSLFWCCNGLLNFSISGRSCSEWVVIVGFQRLACLDTLSYSSLVFVVINFSCHALDFHC